MRLATGIRTIGLLASVGAPAVVRAQQPIDIVSSAGWAFNSLHVGNDPVRQFSGLEVHIAPRLTFAKWRYFPWSQELPFRWLRLEAPAIELGLNHFKGISLVHPDTGFASFDYRTMRVELEPDPRFALYGRFGMGMRTLEVKDDSAWNYIGSGRTSGVGAWFKSPLSWMGDRGITVEWVHMGGSFYKKEHAGKDTVKLPVSIPFKNTALTIAWSGKLTGADIPRLSHSAVWSTRIENDAFGGANSDSAYTQGLQARIDMSYYQPWIASATRALTFTRWMHKLDYTAPAECADIKAKTDVCGSVHYGFAQTQYTPDTLQDDTLLVKARPYAAYLYAFAGSSLTYKRGIVSTQLQIGTTGRYAFGEDAQAMAHWTWAAPRPRPAGWANQLQAGPQLMWVNQYEYRLWDADWCPWCKPGDRPHFMDLSVRGQTDFGSIMDRVSPGGALRVGYNYPYTTTFQRLPVTFYSMYAPGAEPILTSRVKQQGFWFDIAATDDYRWVIRNYLIDGTYADANGWSKEREITALHGVDEWALGLQGGVRWFSFSYQQVHRSAEYMPNGGPHRFGSVMIGIATAR